MQKVHRELKKNKYSKAHTDGKKHPLRIQKDTLILKTSKTQ